MILSTESDTSTIRLNQHSCFPCRGVEAAVAIPHRAIVTARFQTHPLACGNELQYHVAFDLCCLTPPTKPRPPFPYSHLCCLTPPTKLRPPFPYSPESTVFPSSFLPTCTASSPSTMHAHWCIATPPLHLKRIALEATARCGTSPNLTPLAIIATVLP